MTPAEFAAWFAEFWRAPDPGALDAVSTPDVRFVQPLVRGSDLRGFQRDLRRLLAVVPDLHGTTHRWAPAGEDALFIEHSLSGTLDGRRLEWSVVDRITLRDGKLAERVAWFDPLPVMAAVATRPRAWGAVARVLLGR